MTQFLQIGQAGVSDHRCRTAEDNEDVKGRSREVVLDHVKGHISRTVAPVWKARNRRLIKQTKMITLIEHFGFLPLLFRRGILFFFYVFPCFWLFLYQNVVLIHELGALTFGFSNFNFLYIYISPYLQIISPKNYIKISSVSS